MGIRRATLTIQVYAHLFSCSNCSSFAPGSSFRLLPAFFQQAHPFQAHPYFLVPQDVPGSACIFPAPVLEPTTSPRAPGFLCRRTSETV